MSSLDSDVSVSRSRSALSAESAASVLGGFAFLALVNAIAVVALVPLPSAGIGLRLAHLFVDALETLGLGTLGALFVGLVLRFVRAPKWVLFGAAGLAGVAVVQVSIGAYLLLSATHARNGQFATVGYLNSLALAGFGLAAAPVVARAIAARPKLRALPVVVALAALVVDHAFLRDDYSGIHCLVAAGAALFAGPSLAPLVLAAAQRLKRPGLIAFAACTLLALVVPPSNALRHELFRQPCAVTPWILASTLWRPPTLHAPVTVPDSPWRAAEGPVAAPTAVAPLPALPKGLVVVMVTIDALRADVVLPPADLSRFPTLAKLTRDGVLFTHASTPGTQTSVSLAATFSGRYFSEQRWEDYGAGKERYPYPSTDPAPRFPELLAAHGVATIEEAAFVFLVNRFGVTRGFTEQASFGNPDGAAPAATLVKAAEGRLAHVPEVPTFLYMHFGEPHAPYRIGTGTDYERYLNAVAVADTQLGKVVKTLQDHLGERWVVIVSADHGEAFGEHQSYEHAKTLYEELLHVPLIVRSPLFKAHQVDDRVGLVDLGPTVLDLFQVPTPGSFHGQSLLPLLLGRTVSLSRPLIAEARLERELTENDGIKVIEDSRRKTVEVYDLVADPKELRNIFDEQPAKADRALADLRAFFDARTLRDGGYEPPYKP